MLVARTVAWLKTELGEDMKKFWNPWYQKGVAFGLFLGLAFPAYAENSRGPHGDLTLASEALAQDGGGAAGSQSNDLRFNFQRYHLENGLEVILVPDKSVPLVAVNVWYHVGSGDESPGKSGFAHLFEHMMFQGTAHTGEDAHFPILQALGAIGINGTTNPDRTNYFETVPSHQVDTALWLESDRMAFLLGGLTEESFRNQVDVVRNERRQRYDNAAYGRARFEVAKSLYPEGHPYRYLTIGRHEDLENASLEDVKAFFKTWYVPGNATLAIAGDFEVDEMKAKVERWFSAIPKGPKPERRQIETPSLAEAVVTEVADPFARLVQIQRTWVAPKALSEESFPMDLLADILGTHGWGRLYQRLVLEEGLCQSLYSYLDDRGHSGELVVALRMKPGASEEKALAILDEEILKLQEELVSQEELHRAWLATENSLIWSMEDLGRRLDLMQLVNHFTGDPAYLSTYLEKLRAVSPEALQAAARTWLSQPYSQVTTRPEGGQP